MVGPVMVYGFKSADGNYRKHTRYGSNTYFQRKDGIEMDKALLDQNSDLQQFYDEWATRNHQN